MRDKLKKYFRIKDQFTNWKICNMIYGVIENEYFKESEVFAKKFLYFCKYNPNKIQFITKETRKEIKQIGLEHGFFHRLC